MYIQANIGRNVTDKRDGSTLTLSDTAWTHFQNDVKQEVYLSVKHVLGSSVTLHIADFQVHTGMGEWEGVQEESAHVSIYFDANDPTVVSELEVRGNLAKRLSYLAFQYGQDAIAFVVTDSHLATR